MQLLGNNNLCVILAFYIFQSLTFSPEAAKSSSMPGETLGSENLACSTNEVVSMMSQSTSPSASSSSLLEVTDHLEIDRFDTRLGICSLLADSDSYNPDTVDLTRDPDARSYWLQCFEDSLAKFAQRAVDSQKEHSLGKN